MSLRELEKKVEKLDRYLAKYNCLMNETPEEFRDKVEETFLGLIDRFKIYERALEREYSVRRRYARHLDDWHPSEDDSSSSDDSDKENEDPGLRPRVLSTPVRYSNSSESSSPAPWFIEY